MKVFILQTGEPIHVDGSNVRPMRAINLSDSLVAAGHRVVLWSSAFYHQEKRHRSRIAKSITVSDRLEIKLIPSMGYKRHIGVGRLIDHAQLAYNLKKLLLAVDEHPDVAFVGYPPIEVAAVMIRWLRQWEIPSLLDVKDQWPSIFLDAMPSVVRPIGRVMLSHYFYLAKRAMCETSGISAMAQGYLDWALSIAGRNQTAMDRVVPLTSPHGALSGSLLAKARSWWDKQGIVADGRPRLCFVGSFNSAFDWKPVYEAAQYLQKSGSQCEFVICGEGGFAVELRTMMKGLPSVIFPGWIDRPKIEALAERCLATIAPYRNIPNFTMNIPNKIIDALSLGLPIICPLDGEVARLIDEYGVGLRYGTDTGKHLYDCIKVLIENERLLERISQNARKLYKKRFSFEKVYGSLVKHLEMMAR